MVLSGETDAVVYQSDSRLAINSVFDDIDTVEDLFTIIQNAISGKVDKISVSYDPDDNALDEERTFTVLDFAILK
jgi:hypothetical protein